MNECESSENSALAGLDMVNCAADQTSSAGVWIVVVILCAAAAAYFWFRR